jgi:chloramphenicol 3-O-phosphotransferase
MIEKIAAFDCVILRGLPGSGKSTFAKRLANEFGFVHLEADDHLFVNGEYRFDPARVADAHALVVRDALTHLQAGARVVVANTHVRLWEMAGVVGAALISQRRFCIAECIGRYGNIHSVPDDVILGMIARWERASENWADRVFFVEQTT